MYDSRGQRTYINDTQYFGEIPQEIWDYEIGGYKVLEKWLEGHHGVDLGLSHIQGSQKAVGAISDALGTEQLLDAVVWPILDQ